MEKRNKNSNKIVYSTNPDVEFDDGEWEEETTLPPHRQQLRIQIDRKQRKGKEVTLITGFKGADEDLKNLGKQLKQKCGVGGAVKDGVLLIQGNQVEKVTDYLKAMRYSFKRI